LKNTHQPSPHVATEIAALPRLRVSDLRSRFAAVCGEATPSHNKVWLVKRIAWRLQALAEGDLSERARTRAAELVANADLRLSAPRADQTQSDPAPKPAPTLRMPGDERLRPGTILTRRYKGRTLAVEVVAASDHVALVDGDIGQPATAAGIVEAALSRFRSIDVLVNNAGIFFTKPFTDYTADDFQSLVSTNLEGFLYLTQLAVKQMLAQGTGGSIVTITAALARNPIRGQPATVPMITKGGLETVTQHLAMEYAKNGIRVNAVAPGAVYTPLHQGTPKEAMESLSPMGRPSTVKDIVDAVLFLTDAATVTGQILYVDGGAHFGRW
jgi:NAD(P)-dependent dehydrogenase (short-subunit alcohol dehydrogenase family)